jgi:surface protein
MIKIKCNDDNIKYIVRSQIDKHGHDCSLNHIDVSGVTNMSQLFYINDSFNGDVSKWDVSNVIDMSYMFRKSNFNSDISKWDVGSVINMDYLFDSSEFNQNVSTWKVLNVVSHVDAYYMSKARDAGKINFIQP